MITLEQFKSNAKEHGICEMIADWDNAKSKKQLMDLALNIRAIEYIAMSTASGWGLSPDYIAKEFISFNNGKYVRDKDGYTSSLYCLPLDNEITITTTATLIIGYKGDIFIPKNRICELYICQADVVIHGEGRCVAYLYNSTISNTDAAPVIVKENNKY